MYDSLNKLLGMITGAHWQMPTSWYPRRPTTELGGNKFGAGMNSVRIDGPQISGPNTIHQLLSLFHVIILYIIVQEGLEHR